MIAAAGVPRFPGRGGIRLKAMPPELTPSRGNGLFVFALR
jgi:hypothetical protein